MRRIVTGALLLASILAGTLVAPLPSSHAQLEDLIARAKRAVVVVATKHLLGSGGRGSGFIYHPSGFILTNHHVVEGAVEITVTLPDRRSFPATVVDYIRNVEYIGPRLETITDVAVLKVNASGLPTLPLGDSDTLRQGQELLVLGYPGFVGTEEVTATRGIVSAVRRGWIQTDAAIEPGNSGGPVVDRQGRVVALATFVTGPLRKIGGAVAINNVRPIANSAVRAGAGRYQEFRVTGLEYAPVSLGRRKVFRRRYDPGATGGLQSSSETSSEVTQVQNFVGALLYTVRTSDGVEARNYLDSDGLFALSSSEGAWIYTYPEPALVWPFPPVVGDSWQNTWRAENSAQGVRLQAVDDFRIEAANEDVVVPAGTFRTIRVVTLTQGIETRGSQSRRWRATTTTWWAPGAGLVRSVWENADTRERLVSELVTVSSVTVAQPLPQPNPTFTPSPPPLLPLPTPVPTPAAPAPTPLPIPTQTPGPPLGVTGVAALRADRLIRPGEGLGPIRLGVSLDDVVGVLGRRHDQTGLARDRGSETYHRWDFPELSGAIWVYVSPQSRTITGIETSIPSLRTTAGNSVGSSAEAFKLEFGAGYVLGQTSEGLPTLAWKGLGVWIVLDKPTSSDRVILVGVGPQQ